MSPLFTDLRQSLRQFARRPSYPIVAVLSLSLAIAANGVVFGLADGLILNPFSYPDSSSLVSVGGTFTTRAGEENFVEQHSLAEVADIAEVPGLRDVATFDLGNRLISYGDVSDRVFTALIVSDPLPAMRTPMLYGRGFTAEELAPGGPRVAIVSHRLWANQFGGDPNLVGKTIRVNTDAATLVGVIGPGTPLLGTDLWIPWGGDVGRMPRNRRQFTVIARMADDATEASVNAALATVATRAFTVHGQTFPEYEGWLLRVAPWSEALTGNLRSGAWLLLATGLAVLVVACVNLGSLLLARLNDRARELSVRRALGASRWQVVRLLSTETLLVWMVASIGGVALAALALQSLPSVLPAQALATGFTLELDTTVVVYCALAGLIGALLVTAYAASRGGDGVATSRVTGRSRRALIVTEVTLAVAFLLTAGLFVRSYQRIGQIPLGFEAANLQTMRVTVDAQKYPGRQASDFFDRAAADLATLPGVVDVTVVNQLPTLGGFDTQFRIVGQAPTDEQPTALLSVVRANAFDVLGMPIVAGRALLPADRAETQPSIVVNETFARRYLDGGTTGRVEIGGDGGTIVDVVGVVADSQNAGLLRPARPEIFATLDQAGRGNNQYFFAVRTQGAPEAIVPAVRQRLRSIEPDAPIYYVQSMTQAIDATLFQQRLAMWLIGVFGLGTMVVAVGGVYGLVSFWVASQRREIGIRLAIGGSSRQVTGLVVWQTARLLGVGCVLGVALGIAAGAAVSTFLYSTAATDPLAIGGVILLLLGGGVAAAIVPAMRANAVNPVEVLRAE
jgi:predicted permease